MNDDSLCLRQVHPNFQINGVATILAFKPIEPKTKLSAYYGDIITPSAAYAHYDETLKLKSFGVQGVSKSECDQQGLAVAHDGQGFAEHVSIDFGSQEPGSWRAIAKRLREVANNRGWLFRS